MKINTGSALVDYLLPTMIVGLVLGLGLYGFTNEQYLKKFLIASGNMEKSTDKTQLIVGGRHLKGGSLGGTPSNPVTKCDFAGTCDIDYGDFILEGVPVNFGEYIEINGSAGSSEIILSLLESMAEQIKESDPPSYSKLKTMANLGHIMGDIQKTTEAKANECKSEADPQTCFQNWLNNPPSANYSLPGEFASYLPDFILNDTMSTYDLLEHSYMGLYKSGSYPDPGVPRENVFPGVKAVTYYESNIQGNASIPLHVRNVTKELYRGLNDIGQNLMGISRSAKTGSAQSLSYIDPFTGAYLDSMTYNTSSMDDVTNPNSTLKSHADSYLICINGRNSDSGSTCK